VRQRPILLAKPSKLLQNKLETNHIRPIDPSGKTAISDSSKEGLGHSSGICSPETYKNLSFHCIGKNSPNEYADSGLELTLI
jgi:hypothetical protein